MEENDLETEIEILEMQIGDLETANEALFVAVLTLVSSSSKEEMDTMINEGVFQAVIWKIFSNNTGRHSTVYDRSIYDPIKERVTRIISETGNIVEEHRNDTLPLPVGGKEGLKARIKQTKDWLISLIGSVKKSNP